MRIGVIGFGFAGLMVTANLVRTASSAVEIYVIAEDLRGLGVAYSTTNTRHLLNVIAARMGAFADEVEGFHRWLSTADGALAMQQLGLSTHYGETDFVPRALFGAYLQAIWRDTQFFAAQKNIALKLVPSNAVAVNPGEPLTVMTARGDAIAIDRLVLATGHEVKPIFPSIRHAGIVQNPWAPEALADAAQWRGPVMLMGAGLTMIDGLLMLRDAGYHGEVIAFSRHALLPRVHTPQTSLFSFDKDELLKQKMLQELLHFVRSKIDAHGDWRAVVDALRPHTQTLWQQLSLNEQEHFFTDVASFWNVNRHRMAPQIAQSLDEEITAGSVCLLASQQVTLRDEEGILSLTLIDRDGLQHDFHPSHLINCTGPELNIKKSRNPLLQHMLAARLLEPHANGVGIATDPQYRVWGEAFPNLYAIGSLMTGQLLESTAVPELRAQAAAIAQRLLA